MSSKNFLTNRVFFINLLAAIALIALLFILTFRLLKSYTHHGISYSVPDFTGMTIQDAKEKAQNANLKITISDSVYSKEIRPGAVIDQIPKFGEKVKTGRLIYLTINTMKPEKVKLPKLTDISFRQAQVVLKNSGLTIDSISYKPSEYDDLVLKVYQDTTEIFEGSLLVKGSAINLVVGRSEKNTHTPLPDLKGMFLYEARAKIIEAGLNLGVIIYDESVKASQDSLNAVVWKQSPGAQTTKWVNRGTSVDIWLKTNEKEQTDNTGL